MSIGDEIAKLHDLHRAGALSDAEFARAKERALSGPPAAAGGRSGTDQTLGRAANRFVSIYLIMAAVGAVLFLVIFFGFFKPMWEKNQRDFDQRWNENSRKVDEAWKSGPKPP